MRKVELMHADIFETYPSIDRRKVVGGLPHLSLVRAKLKNQLDLIDESYGGSVSTPQPKEK